MSSANEHLKLYQPFIDAIVAVFDPFVEVAVHDLVEGTIAALYNPFSRRKVGEKSPLKELKIKIEDFPDYFTPYSRRNWDGRELKCTSITVRDERGNPILLICLNIDTTVFAQTKNLLDAFLKIKPEAGSPIETYGGGCEEQVGSLIDQFLKEAQESLSTLERKAKKELIEFLHRKGAFNFKNAVPYIAQMLHLSRASIYNYLKEIGASP